LILKKLLNVVYFFFEVLKKVTNYYEFLKSYRQNYINIEAKLNQKLSCLT